MRIHSFGLLPKLHLPWLTAPVTAALRRLHVEILLRNIGSCPRRGRHTNQERLPKKMREFHPDLNPEKAKAQKRTRELNIALEVLTDPVKRKRYDDKLRRMGKAEANAEFEMPDLGPKRSNSEAEEASAFEFDARQETAGARRTPRSPNRRRGNRLSSIWMLVSTLTAGISAVAVSLMALWIIFRMDPTGLMMPQSSLVIQQKDADFQAGQAADSSQVVAKLQAQIERLKTQVETRTKELTQASRKKEDRPQPEMVDGRIKIEPETLGLVTSWLVEYRYAKELVELNRWTHHWWHPSHQANWAGNGGAKPVQMRPVLWYGVHFYPPVGEGADRRWAGVFTPQMRPVALYASGKLIEPDREKIEREVANLLK